MYLTREQARAELERDGNGSSDSSDGILNHALRIYPQSARTNFYLITGYRAGTDFGTIGGKSTEDLFTVSRW
jgi:hypothetical protein